jgi:AraC-like DNA-binding protein
LNYIKNKLAVLIEQKAVSEGITETQWPGLTLGRSNQPVPRFPLVYVPSICIVAQGQKNVFVGDNRIIYNPLHYLIVALPMPLEAEIIKAETDKPFLSLSLEIDISIVGKLLLEIAEEETQPELKSIPSKAIYTSKMTKNLQNAFERLLGILQNPVERRILGPGIVQEILYHILKGEQGSFLRAFALRDSSSQRIAKTVRHLQKNYHQPLDVGTIAKFAGMGNSTLHHSFEKLVGQSPIQYLKKIRLHNARLMIVSNGLNASEAAFQVGYNNLSQFSREFKRQFGHPPSRATEVL